MKIIIFGTGVYYQDYKKWFRGTEIMALLDNDVNKQGGSIDGIKIVSPAVGIKSDYDKIFILSIYCQDMKKQLLKMGADENKIFTQNEINNGFDGLLKPLPLEIYYKDSKENIDMMLNKNNKIIALLSHDLHYNGACIVLLYAADCFKMMGYEVVLISVKDGPLRNEYIKHGINVIIDCNLSVDTIYGSKWLKFVDMVFVNTVVLYTCLVKHDINKPIIWWLHEPLPYYKGRDEKALSNINYDDLLVCGVSQIAINAFHKWCPQVKVKILSYGLPDFYKVNAKSIGMKEKIIFVVVGGIAKIKGQDVFLNAIRLLPSNIKDKSEFWIVGKGNTIFADEIIKQIHPNKCMKYLGELSRAEMERLYDKIDVLVCPSREDSLPVVVIEAMMNYKPVIVSDHTGVAKYVIPGKSGLIFRTGDAKDLEEQIVNVFENRDIMKKWGIEARKVYEKNFSINIFKKNLSEIIAIVARLSRPKSINF